MPVTPENIAVALGQPAPDPDSPAWGQWELWIADAEMLIEARRVEVGAAQPDAAKVDYVIREAVVAQIKKPDDATQVTVSIDDGSTSKSYRSSKGRVTILDEWWKLLGLVASDGKAFHIDTVGGPRAVHLAWCALGFAANFCSCGADIAGVPIFENPDA